MNIKILTLLAFGLSDRDIGSSLCLAPHTIRNRVSRMLQSSGFESRSALALYFIRVHRLELQAHQSCNEVITA
jgi:DNA-binding NarL/FixJ family response regulator